MSFLSNIFSIKKDYLLGKKFKTIVLFGFKIKCMPKLYKNLCSGTCTEQEERELLKLSYKMQTGRNLDLDNPQTFNEKIQWMKLYYHNPKMTMCADKYRVRDFIKETIGEKYLTPLIGVYDNVEYIDFDKLPDKFVMKVNWGSGQNIIVKDKSKLNIKDAKEKLKRWMSPKANHYYVALEWVYKNIEPKIIIEEYLEALGNSALDYKFMCFNGKPYYCWVSNKNLDVQERSFYDMNWVMQDIELIEHHKIKAKEPLPKPDNFDEMVDIANKLCQGFPHVRVDLYKLKDGSLKFGELTFMTSSGHSPWSPESVDKMLGDLIDIEQLKRENMQWN